MKHVDSTNFEEIVLKSDKPVLVDFWAEWCGPCKVLGPILEEVSKEIGEQVEIVKLNVDDSRELTAKYGIRGIPTMIMFKNGQSVSTLVGSQPKNEVLKFALS